MTNGSRRNGWLTRGVLAIGLASLFSDISHEMATVVLPLFLIGIGGSAAALGAIEGFADFFSSVAKLYAGYIGGRLRRKRWATSAGYVVTALATGAMSLATIWPHVLIARVAGWLGRGFRSPLRDTLMAEQTTPDHFGKAFGLERAMDSVGAVVGPCCCLLLLWFAAAPQTILALALAPGLVAAAFILWGSREDPGPKRVVARSRMHTPAEFRRFLVAVGLFGLGDFSRTQLIYWATEQALDFAAASPATLPILLYVLLNVISSIGSYVSGHLSDAVGRKWLLVGGYATAAAVSAVMMFDNRSVPVMLTVFVGSGIYMGIQEPIERATAADLLSESSRSFGFGLLATINGVGDLLSSLIVGALWTGVGRTVAFGYSAALLLVGTLTLAVLVRPYNTRP